MSFLQPSGPVIDLGVNIDHVATLRNARGTVYPDQLRAALLAEQAGADVITLHLREDRRHIRDADVVALIFREEMYKTDDQPADSDGVAEIIIAKQRNGPVGSIDLMFLSEYTRFESRARDWQGGGGPS